MATISLFSRVPSRFDDVQTHLCGAIEAMQHPHFCDELASIVLVLSIIGNCFLLLLIVCKCLHSQSSKTHLQFKIITLTLRNSMQL